MGTIYKRGGAWYVNVVHEGRRIRKKVGTSKKIAELALTPGIVAQDGFLTTHLIESLLLPERELIKEYCLRHLKDEEDIELESDPDRELTEEFFETIKVKLSLGQYTVQPQGFVIENHPVRSGNMYARGQLTVRLYRIYEVRIVDAMLCRIMMTVSQLYSDQDVGRLALQDFENYGKGRFNTILTLPVDRVTDAFRALIPEERYREIIVDDHVLEESVLAILADVDVPQYQKI